MKSRIVSGIQPTGRLHIGNYLGALKHFVELQNDDVYECLFFIADYHSLTEYNWKTPKGKQEQILDLAASFLAAGLKPSKVILFQQSRISAHTELAWILNTLMSIGELNRMTQFKEKGEDVPVVNAGLLTYPVLMAADILLYDAAVVPVGSDQDQHLELTRSAARKFNARFGATFREPNALYTVTPRLMSLDDPMKKMSKSRPGGCLFIDDKPQEIRAKIAHAVTDSGNEIAYGPAERPAIANLITLYARFAGIEPSAVVQKFRTATYAEFKTALSEVIVKHLAPVRERKQELLQDPEKLDAIFERGSKKAEQIALKKLDAVKRKVGVLAG